MTVVSVTFDGTIISAAESESDGGTWDKWGATQSPTQETDFVLQGSFAISNKVSNTTGGVDFDDAGVIDYTTPKVTIAKIQITTTGLIDLTVVEGVSYQIGSGGGDYYNYYLAGLYAGAYPVLRGGWLIIAIDPNEVAYRDATTGTPVLTAVDYYGLFADISATVKSENVVHDRLDHIDNGTGLTLVSGDGADPDGVFQDFLDFDQDTSGNRMMIASQNEDEILVYGVLTIGTATATVFNDSNFFVVFPNAKVAEGFFGIDVGMSNASQDIDFSAGVFKSLGRAATRLFFDTALQVNGTTEVVTLLDHGYSDGDYVAYSDEGGADAIGLTDGNSYWVFVITSDTIALHATKTSAMADTTRVGLTAASAPGENHSFLLNIDTRADHTVVGTTGIGVDWTSCSIDGARIITLTSVAAITGGFILRTGNIVLSTAPLDGVDISTQTTTEGDSLLDPLTTLANISDCSITAGTEGHFARLTSTGTFSFDANTLTGFWTPQISGSNNGWEFDTITGVDAGTDIITTNANHGFSTGDAVFYNDQGGTDTIGLTDLAKYYARAVSVSTLTLHVTRSAAVGNTSIIDLSDGSTGETHSLESGKAALFNDSAGAITVNVSGGGTTPFIRNGAGATTTVNNTVTIEVTGVTEGAGVTIHQASDDTVLLSGAALTADGSGAFKDTASFNYIADTEVLVRARDSGRATATIIDDNGAFIDDTGNANTNATGDMQLLPATPVVNEDRYLFGHHEQFGQLKLDITTAGTGGFTITWQYWNGAWVNLSGVSDGTSSFSVANENVVSWTIPGDWATTTINSQGPYYYVRAHYTAGTVTVVPIGRSCKLDVTRYRAFVQTNTIVSTGLSVKATWIEDTVASF